MKILKELILREIAGDAVLVPVGKTVLEHNGLFALNEVGADIWKCIEAGNTPEEIVTILAERYDAPETEIRVDTQTFLRDLASQGILEYEEKTPG